jgi:hypothetical protein
MLKFIVLMKSNMNVGMERVAIAPYRVPEICMGKVSDPAITKDTHAYTVGINSMVFVKTPM